MVFSLPNMESNIWHWNFAKMLLCDDGESGPDTPILRKDFTADGQKMLIRIVNILFAKTLSHCNVR